MNHKEFIVDVFKSVKSYQRRKFGAWLPGAVGGSRGSTETAVGHILTLLEPYVKVNEEKEASISDKLSKWFDEAITKQEELDKQAAGKLNAALAGKDEQKLKDLTEALLKIIYLYRFESLLDPDPYKNLYNNPDADDSLAKVIKKYTNALTEKPGFDGSGFATIMNMVLHARWGAAGLDGTGMPQPDSLVWEYFFRPNNINPTNSQAKQNARIKYLFVDVSELQKFYDIDHNDKNISILARNFIAYGSIKQEDVEPVYTSALVRFLVDSKNESLFAELNNDEQLYLKQKLHFLQWLVVFYPNIFDNNLPEPVARVIVKLWMQDAEDDRNQLKNFCSNLPIDPKNILLKQVLSSINLLSIFDDKNQKTENQAKLKLAALLIQQGADAKTTTEAEHSFLELWAIHHDKEFTESLLAAYFAKDKTEFQKLADQENNSGPFQTLMKSVFISYESRRSFLYCLDTHFLVGLELPDSVYHPVDSSEAKLFINRLKKIGAEHEKQGLFSPRFHEAQYLAKLGIEQGPYALLNAGVILFQQFLSQRFEGRADFYSGVLFPTIVTSQENLAGELDANVTQKVTFYAQEMFAKKLKRESHDGYNFLNFNNTNRSLQHLNDLLKLFGIEPENFITNEVADLLLIALKHCIKQEWATLISSFDPVLCKEDVLSLVKQPLFTLVVSQYAKKNDEIITPLVQMCTSLLKDADAREIKRELLAKKLADDTMQGFDADSVKELTDATDSTSLTALPSDVKKVGEHTSGFGVRKYVYVGDNSQGNHFINNKHL